MDTLETANAFGLIVKPKLAASLGVRSTPIPSAAA